MIQQLQQFKLKFQKEVKQEQIRLKNIVQALKEQCGKSQKKIQKEFQKLEQISQNVIKVAKCQMKSYRECLKNEKQYTQIIDISLLSNYLKTQKQRLSEIVGDKNESQRAKDIEKNFLHKISSRKKLQEYLKNLQVLRIEKEIEYIQKNIIKSQQNEIRRNCIYEEIQAVTLKQEREINERIKERLVELQRVVSLSNQCGGNINFQTSEKIDALSRQSQRLQTMSETLQRQTKQIVQVHTFFKNYQTKELTDFFQIYNAKRNQRLDQKTKINNNTDESCKNISNTPNILKTQEQINELNFIKQYEVRNINMKIFKKPFQQVFDYIRLCKTKLKKLKI